MHYRVAVTRAFAEPNGHTIFGDIGLDRLERVGIEWRVLDDPSPRLSSDQLAGFDAVLVLGAERVDSASIPDDGRLRHVARFGAGFDSVDVDACTAADVIVTNTPDAVRRPVADAGVALLFALAHNLVTKDSLVRQGRWDERSRWHGHGLTGRTIGVVGLGGIGTEFARLVAALGMHVIAYNRSERSDLASELGLELCSFDDVLRRADYLVVAVAANEQTVKMIGRREFGLMRPESRIINLARGSVIDEAALIDALTTGRIAGAGLDVFEQEPLPDSSPLTSLDSVILAPHSLCWTESFVDAVSTSVIDALIAVSRGRRPAHPVNVKAVPIGWNRETVIAAPAKALPRPCTAQSRRRIR